jgi:hypothetical protein
MTTMETPAERAKKSQAERVIEKFGGARALARALAAVSAAEGKPARCNSSVYRWTYPKSKGGTGGMIPVNAIPWVIKAARIEGIFLKDEDLYPGEK